MSLPVLVVSGFLGAGKTTLINRMLLAADGRRIAAVVNDFGAINIDAELIVERSETVLGLANGCICCSLQGDLLRTLKLLTTRADPLDHVVIDGREVAVHEEIVVRKPFGQLKRFVREGIEGGPRLLIVAPMSGHYATLLRGTVERMLPFADVFITDWRDAKLAPLADGRFDLDDYIDYVIGFLETIGPGAHVLAVCQPSVPCLAAAALMSARICSLSRPSAAGRRKKGGTGEEVPVAHAATASR